MTAKRVVLITGAFGVLGAAVARRFAAEGAQVVLVDRVAPPGLGVARVQGAAPAGRGRGSCGPKSAAQALQRATEFTGGLDVLVNVAGGFQWQLLGEGDLAIWEAMFTMNLKTAVVACRAALPYLRARGSGRIVNIGAGAAGRAAAGMGAYTASKAGVERLTEALADELKDHSINVNTVLPGTLDTPRNRQDMPQADFGRWVQPAALADVVGFLAWEGARAVTGAAIRVFGRG